MSSPITWYRIPIKKHTFLRRWAQKTVLFTTVVGLPVLGLHVGLDEHMVKGLLESDVTVIHPLGVLLRFAGLIPLWLIPAASAVVALVPTYLHAAKQRAHLAPAIGVDDTHIYIDRSIRVDGRKSVPVPLADIRALRLILGTGVIAPVHQQLLRSAEGKSVDDVYVIWLGIDYQDRNAKVLFKPILVDAGIEGGIELFSRLAGLSSMRFFVHHDPRKALAVRQPETHVVAPGKEVRREVWLDALMHINTSVDLTWLGTLQEKLHNAQDVL